MAARDGNCQMRKGKIDILMVVMAGAILVLAAAIVRPLVERGRPRRGCRGCGVVCGTNVYGLARAMIVYARDTESGRLPLADQWCDLLIMRDYCNVKHFVCKESDAIEGESSYALNKNVAGKRLSELAADVVLLFETDLGKDKKGRKGFLKDRTWYQASYGATPNARGETRVYRDRWNQVGGAEILSTKHHKWQGCNVAFVDTHVDFVKTADLGKLKWETDRNEE